MNKDNYNDINDFLSDPSFLNWVKGTDAADAAIWNQWLKDNPHMEEIVEDAAFLVRGKIFNPPTVAEVQVERALNRLNHKIDNRSSFYQRRQRERSSTFQMWKIAAAIAVILVSYLVLQRYFLPQEVIHHTAYGEQINLKLADGTMVALNANSTLRYYSNHSKEVWLEGEAFFKVEKKDTSKAKFLVHTDDLVVEVLGTAFNVNSHAAKTQVVLKEGKVKLNLNNGKQRNMVPGDLISYSAKSNKIIESRQQVRPELHTSWKDGTLIFENISMQKAMEKIRETYGLEILFTDEEAANRKITLAVPTKNLEICIKAFEKALNIQIERTENDLIIINKE